MSSHITGRAASAREQARGHDGKFGAQEFDRANSVDLEDPSGGVGGTASEPAHPLTTPGMAVMDERRGHALVPASATGWPALYATEDVTTDDKIVHARYFGSGGQEWLVTEMDQETGEAFGYADLGTGYPEWGYSSLPELGVTWHRGLPVRFPAVERDLDFAPARFADVTQPHHST